MIFGSCAMTGSTAVGILRMLGESLAFADTKGTVSGLKKADFKIKYTGEYIHKPNIAID
jgi:hypothetical protein